MRITTLEITKGIHLVPGVRGANSYLIFDKEYAAIVDTGMPGNEGKITDYIKEIGKEPT